MVLATLAQPRGWPMRRWATAAAVAIGYVLVVAVPTDLVDTPVFSREIAPTWWSWPALVVSAVLAGLLVASYVGVPSADRPATPTSGWLGGVLTFFAVGCPVCNKVVLVLLGTSGALTWFEPLQPVLQLVAVALLGWALFTRLRGELVCPPRPLSPDDRGAARV